MIETPGWRYRVHRGIFVILIIFSFKILHSIVILTFLQCPCNSLLSYVILNMFLLNNKQKQSDVWIKLSLLNLNNLRYFWHILLYFWINLQAWGLAFLRTRLSCCAWDMRPRISTQFQLLCRRQKLFLSCRNSRQHLASADEADKHLSASCWNRITRYVMSIIRRCIDMKKLEDGWVFTRLIDTIVTVQYQDRNSLQETKPVNIRRSLIR